MGSDDLWYSVRAIADDPWPAPINAMVLNATGADGHPGISGDGLEIWFSSDRAGGPASRNIWTATRATRQSPWSVPAPVAELSDAATNEAPQPDPGGTRIVLGNAVGADEAIYEATRASRAMPWSTPSMVAGVDINAVNQVDSGPVLDGTALVVYFSSDRDGDLDLYMATRPSLGAPFGPVAPLAELNTTSSDNDPWISPDQHHIVFIRSNAAIYEASR